MPSNLINPLELDQQLNKSLVLSSRQMGWNGILVEQYQNCSPTSSEVELPALSDHWLNLPLGKPVHLIQKRDDRVHESIVKKGDSIFVPAGQPSYWCCGGSDTYQPILHIHLKPESITQVAETSEVNKDRIELANCFSKHDLHLQNIAMLLLALVKVRRHDGSVICRIINPGVSYSSSATLLRL